MESHSSTHLKFHPHLPLFNNFSLCLGGHPIFIHQWSDKGINTLSDITSDNTLRCFQDLKSHFNLPGTYFFFYLRSALRAYGVPWGKNLEPHPIHKICGNLSTQGLVSALYTFLSKRTEKKLCSWIVAGAMISQSRKVVLSATRTEAPQSGGLTW